MLIKFILLLLLLLLLSVALLGVMMTMLMMLNQWCCVVDIAAACCCLHRRYIFFCFPLYWLYWLIDLFIRLSQTLPSLVTHKKGTSALRAVGYSPDMVPPVLPASPSFLPYLQLACLFYLAGEMSGWSNCKTRGNKAQSGKLVGGSHGRQGTSGGSGAGFGLWWR